MGYKDKEKQREYQRRWIAKRRAQFFADKYCVICGSTDRLELDHIDPQIKIDHRIWSWSKERQQTEIDKCQVLCEHHHLIKTNQYISEKQTKPLVHGTIQGYKKDCRCEKCCSALRQWWRNRRKQNIPV